MVSVTTIGSSFLYGCMSLKSLDLTSLSNVTAVDSCFVFGCPALRRIDSMSTPTIVLSKNCPSCLLDQFKDDVRDGRVRRI